MRFRRYWRRDGDSTNAPWQRRPLMEPDSKRSRSSSVSVRLAWLRRDFRSRSIPNVAKYDLSCRNDDDLDSVNGDTRYGDQELLALPH
jgi:hypothetical protein